VAGRPLDLVLEPYPEEPEEADSTASMAPLRDANVQRQRKLLITLAALWAPVDLGIILMVGEES
jgi:hypothetical protein